MNTSQNIKFSERSGGMDVSEVSQDNRDFHIYDFEDTPVPANYEACLKTGNFGGLIDDNKSQDDVLDNTTQNTSNY